MANSKSATKRIKVNKRNHDRNLNIKSSMKTFIKKYFQVLKEYEMTKSDEKYEGALKLLSIAYSKIDKAQKNNLLHRNTAAHKKARLKKALAKFETN